MDQLQYNEDEIIRYLRNEMTEEEKQNIEAHIKQDSEFRNEVDFHRKIMTGLALNFVEEKKKILKEHEDRKHQQAKKRQLFPALKIAAVLLIVIAAGLLGWYSFIKPPSAGQVAGNHFKPYPNHLTKQFRGNSKNVENSGALLNKAMNNYSVGKYKQAVKPLETLIEKGNGSGLTRFYLANAYLATEQPAKAVKHLEKAQGQITDKFSMQNEWYLVLAYLEVDKINKAEQVMSKICAKNDGHYCKKVQQLRKELE